MAVRKIKTRGRGPVGIARHDLRVKQIQFENGIATKSEVAIAEKAVLRAVAVRKLRKPPKVG